MVSANNGGLMNGTSEPTWEPLPQRDEPVLNKFYTPPENRKNAELALQSFISKKHNLTFSNYEEWYEWSCKKPDLFWECVLHFTGIKLSNGYSKVLETEKSMKDVPKWFIGAKLNYAENCLLHGKDGRPAFIHANTGTSFKYFDYATLRSDVAHISTALRKLGVVSGDKVCGYLPNLYETAVAMLASATIGAVWASASVDFGPTGVHDRFSQIQPKILFVTNMTSYKQKHHSLIGNVDKIVAGLPSLEKVVVIPFDGHNAEISRFASHQKMLTWQQMKDLAGSNPILSFEQVSFDHPLFILFSSGTTGIPKGMIHTVGRTLLKHVEEHIIQADMNAEDTIMFYTTCGWMMWNWLMTVLYTGASIVLYDESPLEPDPHVLLKVCQNTQATIIGMGAKIWDEYAKMNVDFKSLYNLSNLRLALSTASPLKASSFVCINNQMKPQIVIGSISGGTDIVGCFVGASLNCPVVPGECQHFYLGMDMHAFSSEGKSVIDEQGELVCCTPFPSMPSAFINDPNGERYFNAYFNKFEGIWTHGDFCLVDSQTHGVTIFGRSDATLNRGGVRIGTAEVYNVVERMEGILDSLVVGKQDSHDPDNELVILFIKLADGHELTHDLIRHIKLELRTQMSPRHIPNEIYAVADIPYTNSGKKVELAVKEIIHNKPVKNISSLRNPECLDFFKPYACC